jgi:hypothetical protein
LVIDPFVLHPLHRQGIMDMAGDAGKTVVQQFIREFRSDRELIAWLIRFASGGPQTAGQPSLGLGNSLRPGSHPASGRFKSAHDVPHPNSPAGRNLVVSRRYAAPELPGGTGFRLVVS